MPEANVLYSVTAAVVVGLVAWVAVVLKNAKEPWARDVPPPPPAEPAPDVPITKDEKPAEKDEPKVESLPPSSSLPKVEAGGTTAPADATAPATAVVLKKMDEKKPDAEEKTADADDEKKA